MAEEGGSKSVKGLGELIAKLKAAPEEVKKEIGAALFTAGSVVATEAKRNVQKAPRGGQPYTRYNPKRQGVASAPNEAPATDTGTLVSSIVVEVHEEELSVVVKCDPAIAPYAGALEFGTTDGHLQPRPFMAPALDAKKDKAIKIIARAVKKAIEKSEEGGNEDEE